MNNEMCKPYVVSADAQGLLTQWSRKTGYTLPEADYFQGMLKDLESTLQEYFSDVNIVPEEYLRAGLRQLASENNQPTISLDRVYVDKNDKNIVGFLDTTRSVNEKLENTGLVSRNEIDIDNQIKQLSKQNKGREITLLDDVIFGGNTMLEIVNKFREQNIRISRVIAGIAIQEGIDLLNKEQVQVIPLFTYGQVIDEICERDFVAGTPDSGRTIVINGKRYGAPYILPFGKPIEWASIPEDKAKDFSLFSLTQSINLWKRIERESSANVSTIALAKPVYGLSEETSITKALEQAREQLKNGGSV